jgi:hypothetical protein
MSMGPEIEYAGLSFDSVRAALAATYFLYQDMPQSEWQEALKYVVPMQHNFENPIEPGSQDTWIQFWIDEDNRLTQDFNEANANRTLKAATVPGPPCGDMGKSVSSSDKTQEGSHVFS